MDSINYLNKKLANRKIWMILAAALAILTMACIIRFISVKTFDKPDYEFFYGYEDQEDEYVYLPIYGIVGIDEIDSKTYYMAYYYEETSGSLYVYNVILSASQFNKMEEQYLWATDSTGTVDVPDPVIVYGKAKLVDSDIVDAFCWRCEIDESDYYDYFGSLYLDTTDVGATGWIWIIMAICSGLMAFAFYEIYAQSQKRFSKSLLLLSDYDIDAAADEFKLLPNQKGGLLFGDNYLFSTTQSAVIKYSDILWIYPRRIRTNLVITNNYIVINTENLKDISVMVKKNDERVDELYRRVSDANPDVLIGYTSENMSAFNLKFKK